MNGSSKKRRKKRANRERQHSSYEIKTAAEGWFREVLKGERGGKVVKFKETKSVVVRYHCVLNFTTVIYGRLVSLSDKKKKGLWRRGNIRSKVTFCM